MGRFVTSQARIEQTETEGYWRTLDNQLYLDTDSSIYLTPRYLWSDGYTFPGLVMVILGGRYQYDIRPAVQHDLNCRFHQSIKVQLTLTELKKLGYLHTHISKTTKETKVVLEDIPLEYLDIIPITKTWADNTFKRAMEAAELSSLKIALIRFGVFFNLNWWLKAGRGSLYDYDIYHEDIDLVNGV